MNSKIPPHNLDAERALLCCCLVDPNASLRIIADVNKNSFYDHRHALIWDAISNLTKQGRSVDFIQISEQLNSSNQLDNAGGDSYLISLTNEVATSAHIEHYAEIVLEKSALRYIITRAKSATIEAYDNKIASEISSELIQSCLTVTSKLHGINVRWLPDIIPSVIQDMKDFAKKNRNEYIGTGFPLIDEAIIYLPELTTIAARPATGKCLGKGTKVLLHSGKTIKVEDVKAGDLLMGPDSKPRTVLSTTSGRDMMYWVRQMKGVDYRVNADHILSLKRSKTEYKWTHGDIANIAVKDLLHLDKITRWKGYKVAVDFPEQNDKLPLDPYYFGLWLGDGSSYRSTIFTPDQEIIDWLNEFAESRGEQINIEARESEEICKGCKITEGSIRTHKSVQTILIEMGVMQCKHIPEGYLLSSKANRLKLLAGLIDSDGYYGYRNGPYEIIQKRKQVAYGIKFLADSLGYRTTITYEKKGIKATGFKGYYYRVTFNGNVDEIPCKVERKRANPWTCRNDWSVSGIEIEPDCVDNYYGFTLSGDGLFLLEDMTVTHNSDAVLQIMLNLSNLHAVGLISAEMNSSVVTHRLLSNLSGVDRSRLRSGRLNDYEWSKVSDAESDLQKRKIYIEETSSPNIARIRSIAYEMKVKYDIKVLFIDHLQVLRLGKSHSKIDATADMIRGIRDVAKDLKIATVLVQQLSRSNTRPLRRPVMEDLRDSGEEFIDLAIFLHREDYQNETNASSILEWIIRKNKEGATKTVYTIYDRPVARIFHREDQTPPNDGNTETQAASF